jgi:hypothetical protein
MENVGYICEVLACLLFIYEDNVDFEVIWFLKKTITTNATMGFRTQSVYVEIIGFVI